MDYKRNRNRLVYGFTTLIVMFLGLCSRKLKYFIPDFLNVYLGDALWALMIFMLCGFIFKATKTKIVSLIALIFCYLIEISQLYHSSWIDNIRKTTLGGLVLGYVFSWKDLLAYAIGIGIGIIVEGVFYYHDTYRVKQLK
ncbi:TPA: DUF2809 domain-containing protein [Clostridium botulinum]|uniref:ribosomal maturation YjgA family protein n=1 Tax=Clostridium TaxID=1485 RepID=UPI0007732693|nr:MULTISPECIES: DUF2809 domain-containing protein [Clostridium]AUM96058.1 hypothetical protein RSJ11_13175 [Clostridium sporogenes]AVQ53506.1 DUF2809 domain-containing protein [Clostridium botulinum]HBJ2613405.1 DUF2809 domain-containing protein [Clostridium botulinum]